MTWIGLFIALFGMLIVRQLVNYAWPIPTLPRLVLKETGMWLVAHYLFVIIRVGEGLPLSSIGLGTARPSIGTQGLELRRNGWSKSVLWGFLLGIRLSLRWQLVWWR